MVNVQGMGGKVSWGKVIDGVWQFPIWAVVKLSSTVRTSGFR